MNKDTMRERVTHRTNELSLGLSRRISTLVTYAIAELNGMRVGSDLRAYGVPLVRRAPQSEISLGNSVTLISSSAANAIATSQPVLLRTLREGAVVAIGDDTGISGASICAAISITVGARVLIGSGVKIADTDFHPIDEWTIRRYAPLPAPVLADRVVIEDDVFIGAGAIVLKGTTIGRGSVIGAGAVAKGHYPRYSVIAGNPARVIRSVAGEGE